MPTVKASYTLKELEKAWKSFKPVTARNTGLSAMLAACGDLDLKVIKTQAEAKNMGHLFNLTMTKIGEVEKLDPVKKDHDALAFLQKAGDTLSKSPDAKILWQIVAGNRTYNPAKHEWELSASIKKQTGHA